MAWTINNKKIWRNRGISDAIIRTDGIEDNRTIYDENNIDSSQYKEIAVMTNLDSGFISEVEIENSNTPFHDVGINVEKFEQFKSGGLTVYTGLVIDFTGVEFDDIVNESSENNVLDYGTVDDSIGDGPSNVDYGHTDFEMSGQSVNEDYGGVD